VDDDDGRYVSKEEESFFSPGGEGGWAPKALGGKSAGSSGNTIEYLCDAGTREALSLGVTPDIMLTGDTGSAS
jgi:hypothetical protein